jgi:hypothetical protein
MRAIGRKLKLASLLRMGHRLRPARESKRRIA